MTPPSLTVAREILADAAAKAHASGDPFNEIAASAIDVVLAALDQRPARTVPFVDESGRRIGDAVVDGCQIVARVTDDGAAAALRASVGPRGVSVGYRVEVKPEPATPAAAAITPGHCNECGAALPLSPGRLGCAECYGDGPPLEARPADPDANAVRVPVIGEGDGPPIGSAQVGGGRATITMAVDVPADPAGRSPIEVAVGRVSVAYGSAVAGWPAPVDFRATMPSHKLGSEWIGATRDGVFGPVATGPQAATAAKVEPTPALELRVASALPGAAQCQRDYGSIMCRLDAGHEGDHVSFQFGSRRVWSEEQLAQLRADHGAPPEPPATAYGTAIPPDALVSEMLPCPFCGKRVLLGVEMAPVSGCPAVWCRACGAWGPPGRGNAEDSGEAIANWNRRKPNTVRLGGGIEVRTRDQAVSLFGRGTALADAPLPFRMVDGTAIAEPAPGAARVLCGLPVDGGSCALRYGHDAQDGGCSRGRMSPAERAAALRADADRIERADQHVEAGHLDPGGRWQPGDPPSAGYAVHNAAEVARREAIRKVAADAKLGDAWAERMIDAGTTVEQARHLCRLGRGRG